MGSNLTATLDIKLIDDVSKPAKSVAAALKEAEAAAKAAAKGMAGTGATDRFVKNLSGLKLAGKDIETVAKAWKDYTKSAGLAADSTKWTKAQASGVAAWERQNISALRNVKREQLAYYKVLGAAGGGGVSPMAAAMSQSAMANQRMLLGMAGPGKRVAPTEASAASVAKHGRIRGFMSENARDFASGMVMGSVPMMAGMKAYEGGKELIKEGMAYQHERIALLNAGRTIHELNEMEEAAKRAAKAVPTSSMKENLAILNETTGAFGSTEHAIENLEFMARMSSVIKNAVGDKVAESSGEMGNKFARFFEMRGAAQNQAKMQAEGEDLVRAMIFSRGNFNPSEMLNFAQQAKSAVMMNYNREFLTSVMPSLVTEFGGERAGTKASAFFGTITGKARDKKQAQAWIDAGLLDPKMLIDADMTGNNAIGWKAGAVKDTDLALRNPYEWAGKVLLPALQKAGVHIEDSASVTKYLATMFRNSNTNDFAQVITQALSRQRIDKDAALMKQTGTGKEVMERSLSDDPTMAATAVSAAFENLSAAVMKSAPIASGLNTLAAGINTLSESAESGVLKALASPSGWWADTKSKWGRVGEGTVDWWNKYRGAPGAFSAPASAVSKPIPDLRPTFSKYGDEAFRVGNRKIKTSPHSASATPIGSIGVMRASATPAFAQIQGASPSIKVQGLDAAKAELNDLKSDLGAVGSTTASPTIGTGSIKGAIGDVRTLLGLLGQVQGAAAGAAASAANAAAAGHKAMATMSSLKSMNMSSYSTAGDPAK